MTNILSSGHTATDRQWPVCEGHLDSSLSSSSALLHNLEKPRLPGITLPSTLSQLLVILVISAQGNGYISKLYVDQFYTVLWLSLLQCEAEFATRATTPRRSTIYFRHTTSEQAANQTIIYFLVLLACTQQNLDTPESLAMSRAQKEIHARYVWLPEWLCDT